MVLLEVNVLRNVMTNVPDVIMSMVFVTLDVSLAGELITATKVTFIISDCWRGKFLSRLYVRQYPKHFNIQEINYATHNLNETTLLYEYS